MQTVEAVREVDLRTATPDHAALLKVVRAMTRDQRAVDQMFRRMVSNIRAMNRDDHGTPRVAGDTSRRRGVVSGNTALARASGRELRSLGPQGSAIPDRLGADAPQSARRAG